MSTDNENDSLDKTLSAVIECSFKAVTVSKNGEILEANSKLLMPILGQSLSKGSKLSFMAAYEGIAAFYANRTKETRRENGDTANDYRKSPPQVGKEFDMDIAALLLPKSPSATDRHIPIPENRNTETMRMARARALVACLPWIEDAQEKARASEAVKLWLENERSGHVRDILHEASAGI